MVEVRAAVQGLDPVRWANGSQNSCQEFSSSSADRTQETSDVLTIRNYGNLVSGSWFC